MLLAIYTIISLLALLLVIVLYLVLHRWAVNLFKRYSEKRKRHFEPHVLNLLNDPTAKEPLKRGSFPFDRKFIDELLLQQASLL